MADYLAADSSDKILPPSARTAVLKTLAPIASAGISSQFDAFFSRLSKALSALSQQGSSMDTARAAVEAFQHLNRNKTTFHRLVSALLAEGITQAIDALNANATPNAPGQSSLELGAMDLSLVTFEAMEHKVLIDNLSQTLDAANTEQIGALNLRIAHLLRQEEIHPEQNPFRPEIFLKAVVEAWNKFDLAAASHRLVLHQMRPEVFFDLEPILRALNDALVGHGILPDIAGAYRLKKSAASFGSRMERRKLPAYSRLNRWLSGPNVDADGLDIPVSAGLLDYLGGLQKQARRSVPVARLAVPTDAAVIRAAGRQAPSGTLTQTDENAIELLARMFDFVFREQDILPDVKKLLGQLQIPVMKAALADKNFFFLEKHPARRLVDPVAQSSAALDEAQGIDDPLYQKIEQVVERVQKEYEHQIELLESAVVELEAFLMQEQQTAQGVLSQAIEQALRRERITHAKALAANDVTRRIETGEVVGFVEAFLEQQWVRVLGFAHSVRDSKPEVLQNALKAMDDLIWSVQPKTSPEQRKELIGRLPALLSVLNTWLNAIKWNGPERSTFLSSLAERHASIVRTAIESSPRHQLEMTVNIAQKASERHLGKQVAEPETPVDEFVHRADRLETGAWIELARDDGAKAKCRLAWVSPGRSLFIFAGRRGEASFTWTFEQLAQALREGKAKIAAAGAVLDRALNTVLDEIDA